MSRARSSIGTLPSPHLERLATSHPFVQQIDIVFSTRVAQHDAFTSLKTTYSTAQFTLSELYGYASRPSNPNVSFKAIPLQRNVEDTWSIDPRGILTLSVSKPLYEKLGLVGKKLPFKGSPERYVIQVPLKRETTSVAVQARQKTAVDVWDAVRGAEGLEKWRVACVGADAGISDAFTRQDVIPTVRRETDVYVPRVGDLIPSTEEDTGEDHEERLEALFEWVGMACLGAQRLHANDRVDPYVAVYEPPSPSSIGDVTHLCWKGLMDSAFVQSVIDTAVLALSTGDDYPFVAITLHSSLITPVSYVPEFPDKEAPPRVPGLDAEDTICLILSKTSSESTWAIVQSVGKWDARWG